MRGGGGLSQVAPGNEYECARMSEELIGKAGKRCIICEAEVFLTAYRWQKTPSNEKQRGRGRAMAAVRVGGNNREAEPCLLLQSGLSLGFVLLLNYWQKKAYLFYNKFISNAQHSPARNHMLFFQTWP